MLTAQSGFGTARGSRWRWSRTRLRWSLSFTSLQDVLSPRMSSFTYLISGASRSLGLGYSRALLASSNNVRVIAGARNPSSADQLQALQKEVGKERLYILKLDVEDASAVQVRRGLPRPLITLLR